MGANYGRGVFKQLQETSVPVLFENPENIIDHKRERCGGSGTVAYGEEYQATQTVELKAKVTEHRWYTGVCGRCDGTKRYALTRYNHLRRNGKSVCRHAEQRRSGLNKPHKGDAL